jgi:hypothetical protein
MTAWTHIILEGYCMRKISEKKGKHIYKCIDTKKMKFEKEPNPNYDPNYKTPKKPKYCINIPIYTCLEKDCPHFAYTNALEKDYLWMNKKYKKSKNQKKLEEEIWGKK